VEEKIPDSIAHPAGLSVDVLSGSAKVIIPKWKMRQRAELKPRIAAVLVKVAEAQGGLSENLDLGTMLSNAESEIADLCYASTVMPEGLEWDDLDWEDLVSIAWGVWQQNIGTPGGGGLLGKTMGLLAPLTTSSPPKTSSEPSGPVSATSPVDGAAPQNDSSTN